jgi:hypothetical protein
MLKWVRRFLREARGAIREELSLTLGLPGFVLVVLGLTLSVNEERQHNLLGKQGPWWFELVEVVLLAIFLGLAAWFVIRVVRRLRPSSDPVPILEAGNFHCRILESAEEARHINADLLHDVFPEAPKPPDQGLTAQAKNNRRLVGLIETKSDKIVGWSSIWPVWNKAGEAVELGERNDDDLTAADIVPRSRNRKVKYLVLLSFGVMPKYRREPGLALKLGSAVLSHIIEEFLGTTDRSVRLIAIAYTDEGKKLCRRIGLRPNNRWADYGPAGKKPIYVAEVTLLDISRRLGGNYAG